MRDVVSVRRAFLSFLIVGLAGIDVPELIGASLTTVLKMMTPISPTEGAREGVGQIEDLERSGERANLWWTVTPSLQIFESEKATTSYGN
jgi:hypothetical protein